LMFQSALNFRGELVFCWAASFVLYHVLRSSAAGRAAQSSLATGVWLGIAACIRPAECAYYLVLPIVAGIALPRVLQKGMDRVSTIVYFAFLAAPAILGAIMFAGKARGAELLPIHFKAWIGISAACIIVTLASSAHSERSLPQASLRPLSFR
jgi:hypothetical protein